MPGCTHRTPEWILGVARPQNYPLLPQHNTPHTPTPNQQVSPGFFFFIFLYVDLYWLGPYMLMKYRRDQYVEDWELIACMVLWG